jgi:hypothetical protein
LQLVGPAKGWYFPEGIGMGDEALPAAVLTEQGEVSNGEKKKKLKKN